MRYGPAMTALGGVIGCIFAAGCPKPSDNASCAPPALIFGLDRHWEERTTYPGVGDGRLIITNNGEDRVSILDLAAISDASQAEIVRVPVGTNPVELEGPHHAAMDPNGEYYYVGISNYVLGSGSGPHGSHGSGSADGYVLKYRAADNVLVGSARVDPNPGDLTLTRDGKTIYVTHFDLLRIRTAGDDPEKAKTRLGIIDAETMTRKAMIPLCPAAHGVRLSPDDKVAYAACYSDDLAIVKLDDPSYPVQIVKVAPDAGSLFDRKHEPYAIAVSPSGTDVWISAPKSQKLLVYDVMAGRMEPQRTVELRGQPIFGAFTADGSTLYMATQHGDGIAAIDPHTSQMRRLPIVFPPFRCTLPHQFTLTPDEHFGLLVCEGDHVTPGTLVVLDMTDGGGRYHHHVEVGVFPDYVGILRRPQR